MRAQEFIQEAAFTGSKKNRLGTQGQWRNTGPSKDRPARAGDLVGNAAESVDLDEKTDADLCRSSKRLGSSDHSSCVSQGLRAHQSKGKGHTDGQGNYIKGKKIRGSKYGGPLPDWDSK